MINIDASVFIQIANFLLMMIVLNYLLYKPIRGMLSERRAKFAGYEESIEGLTTPGGEDPQGYRQPSWRKPGGRVSSKRTRSRVWAWKRKKRSVAAATGEADTEIGKIKEQITRRDCTTARQALKADLEVFSQGAGPESAGKELSMRRSIISFWPLLVTAFLLCLSLSSGRAEPGLGHGQRRDQAETVAEGCRGRDGCRGGPW